jgi:predicted dehydrogenase
VVAVCDVIRERAEEAASRFDIGDVAPDWQAVVSRSDLDVIDVVTPSATHHELAVAALEAGKHVLCEKPVAYDFRDTQRAADLAKRRGLLTKLGFTFRYTPGIQYAKAMIDDGFVGDPFVFNGYEQNSQWLDPQTPLRQADHTADQSVLHTSSLEGYGAPIIDIGMWWGRGVCPHRGHDAQLHPGARGARHGPDDADEHRRRGHPPGGVR